MSQGHRTTASPIVQQEPDHCFYSTTRNNQSCEFITFKGLSDSRYSKELEEDSSKMAPYVAAKPNQQVKTVCCSCASEVNKTPGLNDFHTIDLRSCRGNEPVSLVGKQLYGISPSPAGDKPAEGGPPNKTIGLKEPPFKYVGIFGCVLASFFFSINTVCVKMLPHADTLQGKVSANFWRGAFMTICCSMAIIYQKSSIWVKREAIFFNIFRTIVGYLISLGIFVAIHWITVGESTAIIYSAPLWTTILGYFILHESFPLTIILAIPINFLGLLMIAKPDLILGKQVVENEVLGEVERHHHLDQYLSMINASTAALDHPHQLQKRYAIDASSNTNVHNNTTDIDLAIELEYFKLRWPGILIALGTSMFIALVFIILKLETTTPIQTVAFWLGVGTMIMSSLVQCVIGFGPFPTTLLEWSLLFTIGFTAWLAQTMLQWALQYEKASIISVVRTVEVAIAFCWSTMLLKEDVLWTSILGAVLIALVVVLLVSNDHIERLLCSRCRR